MREWFEEGLAFVLKEEGGYANNPHDPGGRTNHGVTQRTLDIFTNAHHMGHEDVLQLTRDQLADIYMTYWNSVAGDTLQPGVDLVMFDIAVMSGPGEANLYFHHGAHSIDALTEAHLAFLKRLTTWRYFSAGWEKRINARRIVANSIATKALAINSARPIPATVLQSNKKPAATQEKSTMEKLLMLPSTAASLIGLVVKYGPTVASSTATAVAVFPDVMAKGTDMIGRLKKADVPGAMVDFNAILADLGLTHEHVTTATATAAQDNATLSPSIF